MCGALLLLLASHMPAVMLSRKIESSYTELSSIGDRLLAGTLFSRLVSRTGLARVLVQQQFNIRRYFSKSKFILLSANA